MGENTYQVEKSSQKIGYVLINSIVLFVTFYWFIYRFHNVEEIFCTTNLSSMVLLAGTVFLVHGIKAFRLYFEIYGTGCPLDVYMKIYCKVTPVCVVLPFKTGELFRMYCYGKQLDNALSGIIIILLDRFMDTLAVVTIMILIWMFQGGSISVFVYVLLIFLIFVLLIYFVFPGVYDFWRKYFLKVKASKHKMQALKLLEITWMIYKEVGKTVRGRGIILYFLSLAAWLIEMGSVIVIGHMTAIADTGTKISVYLTSAMKGEGSPELSQFIFFSVIELIVVYLILSVGRLAVNKGDD